MTKTIKVILLLACTLILLSGCTIAPKHEVYEDNGKFYLDGSRYNNDDLVKQITSPPLIYDAQMLKIMEMTSQCVLFDSVAEMKQDILQGNFSKDEIQKIKEMYVQHTKFGWPWHLPNLNTLYEPILPEGFMSYTVEWNRGGYTLHTENETISIRIEPVSQEYYDKQVLHIKQEIEDNDSACYTVNTGDAVYYVRSVSSVSKHYTYQVDVYGISNAQYFMARIQYNKRLSENILTGIGLKPFSE